jgi:hypothetical protein
MPEGIRSASSAFSRRRLLAEMCPSWHRAESGLTQPAHRLIFGTKPDEREGFVLTFPSLA